MFSLNRLKRFFGFEDEDNPSAREVSILKILPTKGSDEHPIRANEFKRKVDNGSILNISGNTAYQKMVDMIPEYVEKLGDEENGYYYYAKSIEEIYSFDEDRKTTIMTVFFLFLSIIFMTYSGYMDYGVSFVISSTFALSSLFSLIFSL